MTADPPRQVTLIVLAWNRWDLTARCLRSLKETAIGDCDVIVVDNGSRDETPLRLAELDWVRVVTLPENLGFVRGNNAGIEAADPASDIVLLNNDLELRQRDWLLRMRECAHGTPEIGIVGCRLVLPHGSLRHAGTYILPDTLWGQQIGSLEKDVNQFATRRPVEGIVFACAYLKRELIDAIGGLCLDYGSYFEDTDYCLRAQEAGFATVLCGDVTLIHDEHGSTRGDAATLMPLFEASRRVFDRKWRAKLEARYQFNLVWQSIMNFPNGYAVSCREYLRALDEKGVRTVYRYVYGPGSSFAVAEPESADDYRLNLIRCRRLPRRPSVSVVYGRGDVFQRNLGRYKIGFTMIEVSGFPAEWVRQANRMDEVWVPSEFNLRGFRSSGLKRPIYTVPLGVDTGHFNPQIRAFPNPRGEFVFFSVLEWGERKEPRLLLKTFNEVFTAKEPVRLVVKVVNRDPTLNVKAELVRLQLKDTGGRISYLFNLDFPHHQLGAMYRSADCFVSVSRGEGWGLPLMEAMACGLPAIASDWGAHQEFLHPGIGYPLRIRGLVPAVARCPYYEGFHWADPDPDHLRHLMREVFEDRDEAARRGQAAAREIAEKWSWSQAAEKIRQRLEAIQ